MVIPFLLLQEGWAWQPGLAHAGQASTLKAELRPQPGL